MKNEAAMFIKIDFTIPDCNTISKNELKKIVSKHFMVSYTPCMLRSSINFLSTVTLSENYTSTSVQIYSQL